jgi:hypothetical protein
MDAASGGLRTGAIIGGYDVGGENAGGGSTDNVADRGRWTGGISGTGDVANEASMQETSAS